MSSITGEKISEAQVVDAVGEACAAEGISLSQFTVTPSWGSPPWYQLYVNVEGKHTAAPTLQQLAERCDQALRVRNCEYEEKRRSGRLGSIKCEVLPEHAWQHFRNSRLLSTGGSPEQYKHVCLLADPKFENKFLTAAGIDVRQTD